MRLSPPTGKTFWPAFAAIVVGIFLWFDPFGFEIDPDVVYWLTTAGGILLVLGIVFNKI